LCVIRALICVVNSSMLPFLRGLPTTPITFIHSPPYTQKLSSVQKTMLRRNYLTRNDHTITPTYKPYAASSLLAPFHCPICDGTFLGHIINCSFFLYYSYRQKLAVSILEMPAKVKKKRCQSMWLLKEPRRKRKRNFNQRRTAEPLEGAFERRLSSISAKKLCETLCEKMLPKSATIC
jgi:hypothetical protein